MSEAYKAAWADSDEHFGGLVDETRWRTDLLTLGSDLHPKPHHNPDRGSVNQVLAVVLPSAWQYALFFRIQPSFFVMSADFYLTNS